MTRSIWKGFFFTEELFSLKKHKYKINNRSIMCLPFVSNKLLHIHNGKQYVPIRFNKDGALGHKMGEFSFSKKKCMKIKKDKKNFKLKK
jgi:ribosomal protein S19